MTQQFLCLLTLVESYSRNHQTDRCLSTSHLDRRAVTSKRLLAPVLPIWYTCVQRYIIKSVRVSVLYNFYTFSLVEITHPTCTSPTVCSWNTIQEIWYKSVIVIYPNLAYRSIHELTLTNRVFLRETFSVRSENFL